jgi:AcrR family transcriptional regulator
MSQNAILPGDGPVDVAERIAAQTMAKKGVAYPSEVRRLLDAALEVIGRRGRTSAPRVADIVAAAGLSNDAFYRHFRSKDALIAAVLEDGTERLAAYTEHQMSKESEPAAQVRRWVEAVLSQTRQEIAGPTLAVLWNGGSGMSDRPHHAAPRLAELLRAPLAELGSADPGMHASLAAHAVVGRMSEYLWAGRAPTRAEVAGIVGFVVRSVA